MSVLDKPDNVPVPLGYCPCEGEPHPDGDIVYLRPKLTMAGGMAAQGAILQSVVEVEGKAVLDQLRLAELLAVVWIRHGVVEWTFQDDEGEPIPCTPGNVELALPYDAGGRIVADTADDLYNKAILAPLQDQSTKRSGRGPTPSSRTAISPTRPSRKRPPSPSSIATTAKVPLGG